MKTTSAPILTTIIIANEAPPEYITETDLETDGLIAPELDDQDEYEYWLEVQECCGGRDWSCAHYGYHPALDERFNGAQDD